MTKRAHAFLLTLAVAGLANTAMAVAAEPTAPVRRVLPIAVALEAARVALADCAAKGFRVSVAIVDRRGELALLAADPDVSPISVELSQRKARTAALFNTKSGDLGARFQASPGYAAAMTSVEPRLSAAQGAVPIIAGGEMVGAMGISGAPGGDKDEACVAAGLAAVSSALR